MKMVGGKIEELFLSCPPWPGVRGWLRPCNLTSKKKKKKKMSKFTVVTLTRYYNLRRLLPVNTYPKPTLK